MKNFLIFTILFAALTITSDAFAYGQYNSSRSNSYSGIYSRKTTAAAQKHNPVSYGSYSNGANHYENRRIANIFAMQKYEIQLAKYEANETTRNMKQREKRQAQEARKVRETAQKCQSTARQSNRNIKTKTVAVANNNDAQKSLYDSKQESTPTDIVLNNRVVDSSDFDAISASIEQDINSRNNSKKAKAIASTPKQTTEQPSFFQRLRWALFGRS